MKVPYDVVLPQVNVLGSTMAYRETGSPQAPVAPFLHGNPTSSYLWRNVLPLVAPVAHCIAPDLIGFGQFRTPGVGEKMILEGNVFVEAVLPGATARKLTDEEMSVYRAPFPTPESRGPPWRCPSEIPIAGEPADVYSTLEKAHEALAGSTYPKLLFAGNPGAIVSPAFAENEKDTLYLPITPARNDGNTIYRLTVKDIPVDAFWSLPVYNSEGYLHPSPYNAYALTASRRRKARMVRSASS